jgi:hypothetical protein
MISRSSRAWPRVRGPGFVSRGHSTETVTSGSESTPVSTAVQRVHYREGLRACVIRAWDGLWPNEHTADRCCRRTTLLEPFSEGFDSTIRFDGLTKYCASPRRAGSGNRGPIPCAQNLIAAGLHSVLHTNSQALVPYELNLFLQVANMGRKSCLFRHPTRRFNLKIQQHSHDRQRFSALYQHNSRYRWGLSFPGGAVRHA